MLDAPALQDDFYLNLVDWSSHNVLAVGLGNCVYLWNACSSKVINLFHILFIFFCVCSCLTIAIYLTNHLSLLQLMQKRSLFSEKQTYISVKGIFFYLHVDTISGRKHTCPINYATILEFNRDVVNGWYCFVQVTKLCDLGAEDSVCSVGWAQRGNYLAVGTNLGKVQVH